MVGSACQSFGPCHVDTGDSRMVGRVFAVDVSRLPPGVDNVVGLTAFGVVLNFDCGPAPHLCVWLMGTTPSYGEPHLRVPPDARPGCMAEEGFAVRKVLPAKDRDAVPEMGSVCASSYKFASGRPLGFFVVVWAVIVSRVWVPRRFRGRRGSRLTVRWLMPKVCRWSQGLRPAKIWETCPNARISPAIRLVIRPVIWPVRTSATPLLPIRCARDGIVIRR